MRPRPRPTSPPPPFFAFSSRTNVRSLLTYLLTPLPVGAGKLICAPKRPEREEPSGSIYIYLRIVMGMLQRCCGSRARHHSVTFLPPPPPPLSSHTLTAPAVEGNATIYIADIACAGWQRGLLFRAERPRRQPRIDCLISASIDDAPLPLFPPLACLSYSRQAFISRALGSARQSCHT